MIDGWVLCNAAIGSGEMTLWDSSDRFRWSGPRRVCPQQRPRKRHRPM